MVTVFNYTEGPFSTQYCRCSQSVLVGAVSNAFERGGGEAAGRVEEELARKECMGFPLV